MPRTAASKVEQDGRSVLYLSYDGLCDPIGQSQVLPYLLGCARGGHAIEVISFEKPDRQDRLGAKVAALCKREGLTWRPQRFHRSPPLLSKLIDQQAMWRAGIAGARHDIDLIHARSYVAGLAGMHLKRRHGGKLIFDMRGFWPDQRREGHRWRDSSLVGRFLYRQWKTHERQILASADHVVCLTWKAKLELEGWPEVAGTAISVIPCCADFELFRPADAGQKAEARSRLGIPADSPTLAYLGSIGTVYLLDQQLRLFDAIRQMEPETRMLFVGQASEKPILAEARRIGIKLDGAELHCIQADRPDVPYWLGAADVGTCLITPSYSSIGVSPTKLAEYLACGIPFISNRGIGDVEEIVGVTSAGHVLPDFSQASLARAAKAFLDLRGCDPGQIRDAARPLFDLPRAVEAYRALYDAPGRPASIELR